MAARARILPRTEFGNPILERRAARVSKAYLQSDECRALVRDMIRTMRATKGVGLAAPQIGVSKAIAVMEIRETPERSTDIAMGPLVIVNPRIVTTHGATRKKWEGCLSFNKAFAQVPRYEKVTVTYQGLDGTSITETASGLWAHIFQHEIDHLNGVRFIDRMTDARSFVTAAEYRARKKKRV